MSDLAEEAYGAALASLPAMTPVRLSRLVGVGCGASWATVVAGEAHPDAELSAKWRRAALRIDVATLWARYAREGISVALLGGLEYPAELAADHEAPAVLFMSGDVRALDAPRVAIVGARRCTHYGREVARDFGRALAEAGVCVVSGLALGIDGAAHEGAIAARAAPPVAVVGSGLDVVYPRRHRNLWRQVADAGCLVSEAPLGADPTAWRFPARNRIVAALANALLVVEAHAASGTRHTVDAALARDVTVLAVPGSIRSDASAGTNRLLREGCPPACDVDDVLVALNLDRAGRGRGRHDPRPTPVGDEAVVLAAVDWSPTSTETIAIRTALEPLRVATCLAHLEIDGWVLRNAGWWERRA